MREDHARRRQEVVDEWGPWHAYNMRLGEGVYTVGPGLVGAAELRVKQVLQLVLDLTEKPLEQLRVIDIGCYTTSIVPRSSSSPRT